MKILTESLVFASAVLIAGSAMAQAAPRQGPPSGPEADAPQERSEAPVSTSRSNKKHGLALDPADSETDPRLGGTSSGPAEAPINTSRSNKKHGLALDPADSETDPRLGGTSSGAAKAPINTTRSNIKRPNLTVDPGQPDDAPVAGDGQRQPPAASRAAPPRPTRPQ